MLRILVVTSALLSACSSPARTAIELREAAGGMGMKQEEHEVARAFDAAAADVKHQSKQCLRFGYTRTTGAGTMHHAQSTVIYNVAFKAKGAAKAEMTLQQDRIPRAADGPSGGYYVFVADLSKAGANKTHLTMYGPSFPTWGPVFDAVKGWAEGKKVECPGTP